MKNLLNLKIEYFLKCAEMSSFSQAARVLGLSQSALSTAIKRLEDDLQTKLFSRTLEGVKLTAAGLALKEHFQKTYAELEHGIGVALEKKEPRPIRMACVPHFCIKFFLPYLREHAHLLPPIHLYSVWSIDGYRAVQLGHVDFAFVAWTRKPKELPYIEIQKDRQAFLGLRKRFPDLEKTTTFEEIQKFPLLREPKPQYRWTTQLRPRTEFVSQDMSSARELILGGYAVGELQVDGFSDEELKLLCESKAPIAYPNCFIYAVHQREILPESRAAMERIARDLRKGAR